MKRVLHSCNYSVNSGNFWKFFQKLNFLELLKISRNEVFQTFEMIQLILETTEIFLEIRNF